MPPKPWQTKKKPIENISQIIQSNPTIKQQTPKLPPSESSTLDKTVINSTNANAATTGAMLSNSTSSYGGYNGLSAYGGYGSYGGYGGYGGGYGGYGGGYGSYGGMYGMGRLGAMGDQNQKGFLFNTMVTLDSFSFLIGSLCQIARSMDQNYEGLSLFYKSFKNLINKLQNSAIGGIKWVFKKIKLFFLYIYQFIVDNIFFMGKKDLKAKHQSIKILTNIGIILLVISLYPLIRKAIKPIKTA